MAHSKDSRRSENREEVRRICEQAAQWLHVVEDGGASESVAFFEWLKASPQHVEAFLMVGALWDSLAKFRDQDFGRTPGNLPAGNVVELSASFTDAAAPATQRRGRGRRAWLLAAAAAVLLVVGAVTLGALLRPETAQYRTDIGELKHLRLSDGSQVALNTASDLRQRFTDASRSLTLQQGEAEFTVAPDRQRPFEVNAAGVLVRALGTRFTIRLRTPRDAEILVGDGRVAVLRAADGATLAELSQDARFAMPLVSNTLLPRT